MLFLYVGFERKDAAKSYVYTNCPQNFQIKEYEKVS
jgi:hypothetical protein